MENTDALLVHVHHTAPAGAPVRRVLRRVYRDVPSSINDPDAVELPDRPGGMIRGCIPYGVHEQVSCPTTYITVLHDPVQRILRDLPVRPPVRGEPVRVRSQDGEIDLARLVRRGSRPLATNNGQTRLLSGRAWASFADDPEAALEEAKANLRDGVACVGVAEHLDVFVERCAKQLGWSNLPRPRPVEEPAVDIEDVPRATLEAIVERNELDTELHRYAFALAGLDDAVEPPSRPSITVRPRRASPSAASDGTAPDLLTFLHIPKAAGWSFLSALRNRFPAEAFEHRWDPELESFAPEPVPDHARVLTGHLPWGVHELVDREVTYVTLLREPVDRVVSGYYYLQRSGPGGREERSHTLAPTVDGLLDFVRRRTTAFITSNGQTRMVAGEPYAYFGVEPEAILETAKANLERCACVGLSERFDEFLVLCKLRFGWESHPVYSRQNVGGIRPPRDTLPEDAAATIRERNQLDVALYEHAMRLFEAQKASFDGGLFADELEGFRRDQEAAQHDGRAIDLEADRSRFRHVRVDEHGEVRVEPRRTP